MKIPEEKKELYDKIIIGSNIYEKLIEQPVLCMLLNKDLTDKQISQLIDVFHVIYIDYEGEKRYAVACFLYKDDPETGVEPEIVAQWENRNG